MNYEDINRRHALEILALREGVDTDTRTLAASVQRLRPTATTEEVRDALDYLRAEGLAERRDAALIGRVWRITPDGLAAHRKLNP